MAKQTLPLTTLTVKGVTYTLQDERVAAILEQLSGITNVIDDETTSIETTWSSDKINTLISNLVSLSVVVVDSLPVSDIDTHTIYLLPKNPNDNNNVYTEYININGTWEEIGDTEIDLTAYTTKVFVAANYAQKTDVYTKGEVDTLIRNITDENTEYLGDETTIHINGVTKVISALYTSNDFKNAVNQTVSNKASKSELESLEDRVEVLEQGGGGIHQYSYLELVPDLDAYTEASIGKIVKYVGQTGKYIRGWDYEKKEIPLEQGLYLTGIEYSITPSTSEKAHWIQTAFANFDFNSLKATSTTGKIYEIEGVNLTFYSTEPTLSLGSKLFAPTDGRECEVKSETNDYYIINFWTLENPDSDNINNQISKNFSKKTFDVPKFIDRFGNEVWVITDNRTIGVFGTLFYFPNLEWTIEYNNETIVHQDRYIVHEYPHDNITEITYRNVQEPTVIPSWEPILMPSAVNNT